MMKESGFSKDSGLFGDLFDYDGNGRTDATEAIIAFQMLEEMQKKEERERQMMIPKTGNHANYNVNNSMVDLDDLDIDGI